MDELRGGAIWGYCESYFTKMKDPKVQQDVYARRDVSVEMLETAKTLEPRTKNEAYLLIECVNLANGNAVTAQDAIAKTNAEDDEFLDDLRVYSTNNANNSQRTYMSKVEGKYDLASQHDARVQIYESRIKQAQAQAMAKAALVLGIATGGLFAASMFGGDQSQSAFSKAATFTAFATAATAIGAAVQNGGANAAVAAATQQQQQQIQANASNVSIAPIGPSGEAAPVAGGSNAVQYTEATSAQVPIVAEAAAAPHIEQKCVTFRFLDEYRSLAEVSNDCSMPVIFYWCWIGSGQKSCQPYSQTSIIEPKKRENIAGPQQNQQAQANFVVCDMTDRQRVCKL